MRRLLQPFVLTVTGMLTVAYAYVTWRLASDPRQHVALAIPFVLVWIVPAIYWGGRRRDGSLFDKLVLQASFLSMGWVSFLLVLTLARDAILLLTAWPAELAPAHAIARDSGVPIVIAGSLLALFVGALRARRPSVRTVDVALDDLHPDLDGFRIAQVTDLHVGRNIRRPYVERVVALTKSLDADLVALTGDMVDGTVGRLADDIAPLEELARGRAAGFFVLGNHDCYSGPQAWTAHFRKLGFHVLLNGHTTIERGRARVVIAGVLDPALHPGPRPDVALANAPRADLRLLLAHNPKSAPAAERAGFDLQLSGHTHGGQFFPWTLVVRRVHGPHHHGLSRRGRMWVYVSPGTGTWGPMVRLGTRPEVTLIRLRRENWGQVRISAK